MPGAALVKLHASAYVGHTKSRIHLRVLRCVHAGRAYRPQTPVFTFFHRWDYQRDVDRHGWPAIGTPNIKLVRDVVTAAKKGGFTVPITFASFGHEYSDSGERFGLGVFAFFYNILLFFQR